MIYRETYTTGLVSNAHFSNVTSLRRGRINDDSIPTRCLCNVYMWGEANPEKQQAISHEMGLKREGGPRTDVC